jgi:hypothetical protein
MIPEDESEDTQKENGVPESKPTANGEVCIHNKSCYEILILRAKDR